MVGRAPIDKSAAARARGLSQPGHPPSLSSQTEARPTPVGNDGTTASAAAGGGGCPVIPGAGGGGGCPVIAPPPPAVDPRNLMPTDLGTPPASAAAAALSGDRAASSIPVAPQAALPKHQAGAAAAAAAADVSTSQAAAAGTDKTWAYPSERQFYEAMRRKGWNPAPGDMPAVVAIHNAVNERAWAEVVAWERRAGAGACGGPRLVRFTGRPGDLSPKARLLNLLGYARPFDRHDWVVDRCGQEVRYVIDFYNGAGGGGGGGDSAAAPVAVHLDVRPALDGPAAVAARLGRQWEWVASGRWRRV